MRSNWTNIVVQDNSHGLPRWRQFGEENEMGHLREPVHYSEDYGWSSPDGGWLEPLPAAQIGQADTNRRASCTTDGHQKHCSINL